ncbi:MAG: ribonuclease E inhibitor RraB [Ignavibacteriae bacterium]|nr:ribonuclease E inhibitor RraB [Ignavibacteria bacterium]MBI3365023.1 ribonuclease E inhibitor RraB [Ignavibacteriota bacterium]
MDSQHQGKHIRAQLERFGSDVSHKHPIDFYFYLDDERQAYLLAAELQRKEFEVTVEESGTDHWLCLARKELIPIDDTFETLCDWLVDLSASYYAEFDGWESEIPF